MSDTLRAEIKNIVFYNAENGYLVARANVENEPGLVTVVGNMPEPNPGELLELTGEWTEHPRFGRQFRIAFSEQVMPATLNGIRRYLGSGMIKGIGPVLAGRLVDTFGTDVLTVLEEEPKKLLTVEGLGKKKLDKILASWDEQHEVRNLMIFLQTHDIPPTYAARIFKKYGNGAVSRIQENPYELAYEIHGIGFKLADRMALRLGFAETAPERMAAAVLYALESAADHGNLFLPLDKLIDGVDRLIPGVDPEAIHDAVNSLSARKRVHVESLPHQNIEHAVYLMHFYRHEKEISSRFYALCEHPTPVDLEKISTLLPRLEAEESIELSEEQREAVFGGCENKVFVVTGGPGTGKTTITRVMVRVLDKLGFKIKLAAPTGRAAKRLSEATGYTASTLHRLLQYSPGGGFGMHEENKLEAQVVVVDEVSMLDTYLCLALLRALPLTCRLVLIGDVNQLPSVGPGNVLADILNSEAVPSARLTRIYRQAQESLIVTNAHRVNSGELPIVSSKPAPENDFFWVKQEDSSRIQHLMLQLMERIPAMYGLDPVRDVQVLTPMHKGDLGTQSLNHLLQEKLNPRKGGITRGSVEFRVGDRVLQTKNNYDKDVFNGDLGWICEVEPVRGELMVDFEGHMVSYDMQDIDELTPAYAISVHKSQGSEYPAVIIPVVTQHYMLLQRNLIYTALTRAKKLAVLIGGQRAMSIGIARADSNQRFTHLQYRLQEIFNGS
ncbi:SF1B family DNA helicase RecD2 [Desulfobaculum bizertense]|uniref:Exodeoxyribonuclease V alpha subunit n=1 Tax=Desulfobaculum bizertense DSM 18034 TaxID=1121442 RepID=A0A1T4W6B1_9BACT|nr:ATP-dependent RecD-like DNA helicase [Desulfobaculum bizertense]UIJ39030.1 ATP-dependent RecD-like DNA helicase [Desulfobaculum bizertense]SKA72812.1 exodeoxyribonuclease V alpha subunit [Desulfobaculum bizertense DSM 18034]